MLQTSLSPCHIPDQQDEADDYSPLLKRARHLFANNAGAAATGGGPPSSSPPLPCRQQSPGLEQSHLYQQVRHNGSGGGDREPWLLRPPTAASSSSPRSSGHDTSLVELTSSHHHHHQQQQQQQQQHHKYDSGITMPSSKYDSSGESKSLLSRALEKSDRGGGDDDSASDDNNTTGSENERPGSASLDGTIKSDRGGDGDNPPIMPPAVNALFPPGLEALYRQAGFPPFLGLGGGGGPPTSMSHHLPGPSTTHIGLQSHAANPTS
jgi:hypothetical protein